MLNLLLNVVSTVAVVAIAGRLAPCAMELVYRHRRRRFWRSYAFGGRRSPEGQ